MKRFLFCCLVIFFIVGFFVLDKIFFHLVFKTVPGSCLILEEKYCKTGDLKYENNLPIGIIYKVKPNSPLFSPANDAYSVTETIDKTKKLFVVGNKEIKDDGSKVNHYQIFFDGDILDVFNSKNRNIVKKGEIFGFTSKVSKNGLVDVVFILKNVYLDKLLNNVQMVDNQEEILKIFSNIRK